MTCIAPGCHNKPTVGAAFCDAHMQAPAGQRGGWLSAHRRRLKMVQQGGTPVTLDASNITPRLWMGGMPPIDRAIAADMLVLCAQEVQPQALAFRGTVLRCPIPDDTLERHELELVKLIASQVGHAIITGKKALVTCYAGLNRSALVTAFTLGFATRMSAEEIITRIRQRRGKDGVLSNPAFVKYIRDHIGAGRMPRRG